MATKRKREVTKGVPEGSNADGLDQFTKVLQELKSNAQSKIKQLTAIAENHKDSSEQMARILSEEILNAQASRVQPLFFVVDSIIKKLGKEHRMHLIALLPELMGSALTKADQSCRNVLQKIVSESWKKHDLLPADISSRLDVIFKTVHAGKLGEVKSEMQISPPAVASSMNNMAVKSEELVAPGRVAVPMKSPPATPSGPPEPAVPGQPLASTVARPPPMKGPPPKPPMKMEVGEAPAAMPKLDRMPLEEGLTDEEVLERRLDILTKIIERKGPSPEVLKEFMRLPELVEAMAMQRQGKKTEAMALLAAFKAELEKRVERNKQLSGKLGSKPADPRQLDPRQLDKPTDPRAVDPRQPVDPRHAGKPAESIPAKPQDPRQRLLESKQVDGKRPVDTQTVDPRQKQARLASQSSVQAVMASAAGPICIDDDDDEQDDIEEVAPGTDAPGLAKARQILQGLPSLGFSEGWLRQFMEQMPVRGGTDAAVARKQAPCIGRKVMGAEGDQMVYVDELSPSEVLLLLQLIFLLEERLQKSGGGVGAALDLTQRIPHTFSFLQVEPAIDVMLKRFFDELPYQCPTTGLRFGSREKLRRHNDGLFRRRTLLQQRQRGTEARGWMETIPEWVGNRDLNVGPALFQLGGGAASEEANIQRAQRAAELQDASDDDGEDVEDSERSRWICPLDERRAVCPISGEPFEKQWSHSLNDWAFSDVVAVELGTADKVLRFPQKNPGDPERLSESALLFKKSCFLNTATSKRLTALEECCSVHALGDDDEAPKRIEKATPEEMRSELEELQAVLGEAAKAPKRKFF